MPADSTSPSVPDSQRRVDELAAELREALRREAAIAEILQVTNASGGDLSLVLNAIIEKATRLCSASYGYIWTYDGESARAVAVHGDARFEEWLLQRDPVRPSQHSPLGRVLLSGRLAHVVDAKEDETYRNDPRFRDLVDRAGLRTLLHVPLRKGDTLLGVITVYRRERQAFTDQQIRLLESFAEQAVIAMENARLLDEQRQALAQQTATAEVLQVINASPGNLAPVFDAMLEKVMHLCDAAFGMLWVTDGDVVAQRGVPAAYAEYMASHPVVTGKTWGAPGTVPARILGGERLVHVEDLADDPPYLAGDPHRRALVDIGGARTALAVPLCKDASIIGFIMIYRQEVRLFGDKQIALLQNFAAQAVIAMENARLLSELRERTDDLTESLEYQTATSEVLEVIGRSTSDIQPVLDTMLNAALRLCRTESGGIAIQQGEGFRYVATLGWDPEADKAFRSLDITAGRGTVAARVIAEGRIVQVPDVAADPDFALPDMAKRAQWRTALGVPLMREGRSIGVIAITRDRVEPFIERQIALVKTFADQAVIAMENARLLGELRESLDQKTATSDVLKAISRSSVELEAVLETLVETVARLCRADHATMFRRRDELHHLVAAHGLPEEALEFMRTHPFEDSERTMNGRVVMRRQTVHIHDIQQDAGYAYGEGHKIAGMRTMLGIPLMAQDNMVGVFIVTRTRVESFTDKEIALATGFADQAVIAMENARLLNEQREALERQIATADVLQVISSSPGNLAPVFDAILEKAMVLCQAAFGQLGMYDGQRFHIAATRGLPAAYDAYLKANPLDFGPGTGPARLLAGESCVHVIDAMTSEAYQGGERNRRALVDLGGAHTLLNVALRKDDVLLGWLAIYRREVRPFSDKQIALVQDFAAQGVIAIENARLLEELRERQAELRVTFDNMGDGVAMFDGEPRLAAWNRNFEQIIGLPEALLAERPSYADYLRMLAERGEFGTENVEAELASHLENTDRELRLERTRADGTVIEVRRNAVPGGGFVLIYSDVTEQRRAEAAIRAARDSAEAALERQTATAEILKVIASSPTDVQPVLDAVAKAAQRFCGAMDALISLREDDEIIRAAHEGSLASVLGRAPLDRSSISGRTIVDARTIHIPDIGALDHDELTTTQALAAGSGARAALAAPMLREGVAVGSILLRRARAGHFTPQQIGLLETFAAQAVIAIENVRLFTELREALEQQTATAEILGVISQSPTDVTPVLAAVAKAALKFCGARDAQVVLRDGDHWFVAATEGPIGVIPGPRPLNRHTTPGRAILDGEVVQIADVQSAEADEFPESRNNAARLGFRSALAAPLLRDDVSIGAIALRRPEPGAFTPNQVELLKSFAAQAVIAIENVRLFTELKESLEQQTATAEILRAISQSPTDVTPVLNAVAKAAVRFCGANDALVSLRDGDEWFLAAHEGPIGTMIGERRMLTRHTAPGRAMTDGKVVQIMDLQSVEGDEFPEAREIGARTGFRAALAAPLLRDDVSIGAISLRRSEVGEFEPRQVELLKTFAAQAVIAIENVRLFTELRDSLERLKAAQANLIQSEKMASLGQLTAGIAHEIKNPLNFVNNFAGLSVELLDELKEVAEPVLAGMSNDARAEFGETIEMITSNLDKIAEHGKRADGIVKSMLSHSRGGTGDWQESNINALVEEALNLAYHGARAQDKEFNVTLERDFAPVAQPIELVPQDVTRVFLNLFGNGFYAANKRRLGGGEAGYRPTLKVSTRDLGEAVEITVRDNGIGIPPEVRAKLFQPFFTTKPTGEGTGLGLSISYDIVTQQHGGTIEVESEPGAFTEFTVRFPRRRRAGPARKT